MHACCVAQGLQEKRVDVGRYSCPMRLRRSVSCQAKRGAGAPLTLAQAWKRKLSLAVLQATLHALLGDSIP